MNADLGGLGAGSVCGCSDPSIRQGGLRVNKASPLSVRRDLPRQWRLCFTFASCSRNPFRDAYPALCDSGYHSIASAAARSAHFSRQKRDLNSAPKDSEPKMPAKLGDALI